jgi:uncharacterized damage-inducible protein DinB
VDTYTKKIIWQQFGAAIDSLENALNLCPEEIWDNPSNEPPIWRMLFHTLFFLDFYLSESLEGFAPPAPFDMSELDPSGTSPERTYTKQELGTYLEHCRRKCRSTIETLTDDKARRAFIYGSPDISVAEQLLYNMRHVQHHAAQLNLILRQRINAAPGWVKRAKEDRA